MVGHAASDVQCDSKGCLLAARNDAGAFVGFRERRDTALKYIFFRGARLCHTD